MGALTRRGTALGVIGTLIALALPASAGALPIVSVPLPPPTLPAFQGSASSAPAVAGEADHLCPGEQVHGAGVEQQHPQRPLDDRRLRTPGSEGQLPGRQLQRRQPARLRLARVRLARADRQRLSSAVAAPQARIIDPTRWRRSRPTTCPTPRPAGDQDVPELQRRRLLLPRQTGPALGPTKTDHIQVLSESADGNSLTLRHDYDLTNVLDTANERITSALPDFRGRIWFVSKENGKVGTLNPKPAGRVIKRMGEEIENSFAVARTASTSSPTSGCTASRRQERHPTSSGRRPTRTRGSSSRARSTPARARRRRSCAAATSRSPTTPTR